MDWHSLVSVTERIRRVRQPRGGYVNPRTMDVRYLTGDKPALLDHALENVNPSIVGSAVEYLTRWCLNRGQQPQYPAAPRAFSTSRAGASQLDKQFDTDYLERAAHLCRIVDNAGDFRPDAPTLQTVDGIAAALELASFDVGARPGGVFAYNPNANTTPDEVTTEHIATMVHRSLAFFRLYGPALVDGFTMLGGYSGTVDSGDGDFVTLDTLWEFKVSAKPPTSAHTLQLLMYWLMASRSNWNWKPSWNWDRVTPVEAWCDGEDLESFVRENNAWPDDLRGPVPNHLGVYNPRLDAVYRIAVDSISAETIAEVSRDVIGYE